MRYRPSISVNGSTEVFYGVTPVYSTVAAAGGYVSFNGGPSTGAVYAGKSCAYCGRYAIEAHGNCDGCGAPLTRREVKPL